MEYLYNHETTIWWNWRRSGKNCTLVGGVLVEGGGEWGPLLVMTIMTTRPISRRKGGGAEGVMLVD